MHLLCYILQIHIYVNYYLRAQSSCIFFFSGDTFNSYVVKLFVVLFIYEIKDFLEIIFSHVSSDVSELLRDNNYI